MSKFKTINWNGVYGSNKHDEKDYIFEGRRIYSSNLPFRIPSKQEVLKFLKKLFSV